MPGGTVSNLPGAGRIRVYPGSPAGVGTGAIGIDQDSQEMLGIAEAGDSFGEALAVGDFDGNNRPDLAIDHPMEANAGASNGERARPRG